jgi:hypothetical protein
MQMPEVNQCEVNQCFYNQSNSCHANAILVGSDHAMCDTFISAGSHGLPADMGRVGACHVDNCKFNNDLSCSAKAINVGMHAQHADCVTFDPK